MPPDSTAGGSPEAGTLPEDSEADRSLFRFLRRPVVPLPDSLQAPGSRVPGARGKPSGGPELPPSGRPGDIRPGVEGDLPAPDAVRTLPDSLARDLPDSLLGLSESDLAQIVSADSLRRAAWSDSVDASRRVRPAPTFEWGPQWGDRAVDRTPRELLPWSSPLRVIESGNAFTPDPLDWGDLPGREPVQFLLEGLPVNPPGMPETVSDPFAISWIESVEIRRPSPLRLPNNPTGGALVEVSWIAPDTSVTVSGARLSDGSTVSNTDEFYFARPGAGSVFRMLWSDHKTAGRLLYGSGRGSQVLVGYEREMLGGTATLWAQHQFAKQRLVDGSGVLNRRWLWNRDAYTGGYEGAVGGWEVDLDLAASWHRFGWEGGPYAQRKDEVQQGILRLRGPGGKRWVLATLQVDRDRVRYWEPGRISFDEASLGTGFAAGLGGVTRKGRYEVSAGRSDPGTEEAGVVWGAEADWQVGAWELQGYAGRNRRARLIPRLGNHLYLQVAQGIAVPEEDVEPEAETLDSAELWAGRRGDLGRMRFGLRATRIQGAISAEEVGLSRLTPAGLALGSLPESALDQELSVLALHVAAARDLGWGFSIQGDGAVRTSSPGPESHLWMTPMELRGRLGWRALLFSEALDLDLFLRGHWNGERTSTTGQLAPMNRFDGGGTAQIDDLSLWLLFVNLEDDQREAATVDGGSMYLPIRSFRMGMTWRFLD